MVDYYVKIDLLYVTRVNDTQLLVSYRSNLHSHYFFINDKLIDLYDIIRIIDKIEHGLYYKCFPVDIIESED